jgi:hypothetical protein
MSFYDQICATVRAMGTHVPAPVEVDGQVIPTPAGWNYPSPVYPSQSEAISPQSASYAGMPCPCHHDRTILIFGLILIALVIITRR